MTLYLAYTGGNGGWAMVSASPSSTQLCVVALLLVALAYVVWVLSWEGDNR